MTTDLGAARRWRWRDLALYLVGVAGLSAALAVMFLGMRAVMDVGGYCADGGPYVIDVHCPDGIAVLIPLSIFLGLGSAALVGIKGVALGGSWAAVVLLAWPALFISLGWNFLEYALNPPGDGGGIVWGWLIPGVLFVLMGAVPLLAFLPGRGPRRERRTSTLDDAGNVGEERDANELRRQRRRLVGDLVQRANRQSRAAAARATPAPGPRVPEDDLVSRLERLAALHRAGSLTYDEYQRAKAAVIGGGGG